MLRTVGLMFYTSFILMAVYLFIMGNFLMIGEASGEWAFYAVGFLAAAAVAYVIRPRS